MSPTASAARSASSELERRLAQQSAVARLGEQALRRSGVRELMQAACEAVTETLDVELASVFEHTGAGRMQVRAGVGWDRGFVGSMFEMASYREPSGRARYAGGPVVIDDLTTDSSWRARPLRAHGVVSSASVIVGDREAPLGLLGAHAREHRVFSDHDLDFLQAVAHVIAGAVERERTEERIRHDALHDSLTGLPNRTLLHDRLTHALARASRDAGRIALFCIDIDHLKLVNDLHGHHAGDDLLRAVGPRLRDVLRSGDTVARFAGDGFSVLCEGVADDDQAVRLADRLLQAFAAPFRVRGVPRFASASIGLTVACSGEGRGPDELIADAEAAMYRAKERGRARHELFDPELRERVRERLRIEDDLRHALDHPDSELWLAYQPFHDVAAGRVAGVEALVRWSHPDLGQLAPADFIPVAEASGLIVDLGAWVLRTACRQLAAWRELDEELSLSVNVSARQMTGELVGTVAAALDDSGLPAAALSLEITEGLLLEDSPATAETLARLRALGVRLVLDDFGTGFSSLGYLRRFPLDALKVDRAFVADLGADGTQDSAIVEAIVGMARALGMPTTAEGVETAAQLERLRAIGCDFAQGFHLSAPLPAPALEDRLGALAPGH